MNEPRFRPKSADEVPPPVRFYCSYHQALVALDVVMEADNDRYEMADAPIYKLRAGTNETRATEDGLFVIYCEQRVRDGSQWSINAGEVYYTEPEKRVAMVRASLAPFPVKSSNA